MNETELRTLVEHDRARHEAGPAPTGAVLERARASRTRRRGAWAAGVTALAVAASLAVIATLSHGRPTTHPSGPVDPNPNAAFAPPPGMRWAGLNGFAAAVPASWPSVIQGLCSPPEPLAVTYELPGAERAFGCPFTMPPQHRPRASLWIGNSSNSETSLKDHWHARAVGDDIGYRSPFFGEPGHRRSQGLFSCAFEIPGKVMFEVQAPTKREALALLGTVRPVPPPLVTIPREMRVAGRQVDMVQRLHNAGFHVRYREEPPPSWMQNHYPGMFIRTDPPVGTPLPPGSTVTVYANNGPLELYVGSKPLRAHHWSVAPPSDFTPRITRTQAVELAGLGRPTSWRTALLRRLTIPGTGVHDRDVWLAVHLRIPNYGPDISDVTVIDATTGAQLAHDTFLH